MLTNLLTGAAPYDEHSNHPTQTMARPPVPQLVRLIVVLPKMRQSNLRGYDGAPVWLQYPADHSNRDVCYQATWPYDSKWSKAVIEI